MLDVILPVHNEAESIELTVREIHDVLSPTISLRFVICEDGSVDDTKNVLRRLSESFPMKLLLSDERKGYSRAVLDGIEVSEAPYLLCLDSDGQMNPRDCLRFWERRDSYDVQIGWRTNRHDNWLRLLLSRGFYVLYQLLFRVPVHDPSCGFVLVRSDVARKLLPEVKEMPQGLFWEFMARAYRRGFRVGELPIDHRSRWAGETQVYRLNKLPGIGYDHVLALFKIWAQTRSRA